MPTGYTSKLHDGQQSFPEFAMECARAFGALVELRDDMTAKIPDEFKPSPYYQDKIDEAKLALERAEKLTPMKAERAAQGQFYRDKQAYDKCAKDKAARGQRYAAMIASVLAWTPPTSDHRGLKDFMLEQLRSSMENDCDMTYYTKPKKLTAGEFKAQLVAKLTKDLSYYSEEHRKEVERCEQRTAWVRALRQSLKSFAASAGEKEGKEK